MSRRVTQYVVLVAVFLFGLGYYSVSRDARIILPHTDIVLSEARARHILYGDETGGGHRYGVGNLCKSEFPAAWSDQHIISTITEIAANDNLTWDRGANGYYVAEDVRGDVVVRVVMGTKRREVVTGYPVNLPRNPCPAND